MTSGQVLAVIEAGAAASRGSSRPRQTPAPAAARCAGKAGAGSAIGTAEPKLAPAVRRLVEEHQSTPARVPGSGPGRRGSPRPTC